MRSRIARTIELILPRETGQDEHKDLRMNKQKPAAMAAQVKYATRFGAEKARQERRYCDAFRLWRSCHFAPCLRSRRCRGDADACLAKAVALDRVPHREQSRARQDILAGTPHNIGGPERAARQCMPLDFYLKRGR
jgi:hypothetical protein